MSPKVTLMAACFTLLNEASPDPAYSYCLLRNMQTEYRDNPYVAVVAKKHRNLKKKMDRILKIESQILTGKALDEEQKIMYTTKSSVEKSLADLSSILSALEEVAKEERERSGESSSSLNDMASEETKGQDAGAVESTKQVAVVETSCSFENKSTSEVVEILLKTICVVRQSGDKAHEDVRSLGQSLLESSLADAHRTAQNLLENTELLSKIDALYQQLNTTVDTISTATSDVVAANSATIAITEPTVSVPVHPDAVKEAEVLDNSGEKEKSRRRPRGKKGTTTATTNVVEESAMSNSVASEANAETTSSAPIVINTTTTSATTTAVTTIASDVPLSTVVSSIPLPSPADIVAATADNILVPKRSFEAATAAVLAESVEINFFPIQPTVSPPELVVPTTQNVPLENNFFLPDQNYLNHIVYPHAPIPAGLPMNSLLSGIPGFGIDYSHGHSPYGLPPVGFEMPMHSVGNGVSMDANVNGVAEESKKKRRNRRGSKDGDREMSATPVNTVTSVAPSVVAEAAVAPVAAPVPTSVVKAAVTSTPVPVVTSHAPVTPTTTNVAPASANVAPVPAPASVAPVPSIVPVMGVGAALRYLQGLAPAPAATVAPVVAAAPVAPVAITTTATSSQNVAPVTEAYSTAVSASVEGTTIEGEAGNKRARRRRGKGEINPDATTTSVTPADTSAPIAPALVVPTTTTTNTPNAAPVTAASACSATEGAAEGEETRSRRVRGTRGKGGKGNKTDASSAASASGTTDNSSSSAAPSKAADSAVKEQRARAPRPATTTNTTTNTATSTDKATTTSTAPRAAGQNSSERKREGAPRPARESNNNTNNTNTNTTSRDANANREGSRAPKAATATTSNTAPATATATTGAAPSVVRGGRPPRAAGATNASTATGNTAVNNRSANSGNGANGANASGNTARSRPAAPAGSKPANATSNSSGAKPSNTNNRPTNGAAVAK